MYDESQPEPLCEPDTLNATKFYWKDKDVSYPGVYRLDNSKTFEAHYKELAKVNRGLYHYKRGDNKKLRQNDNLAIFDAVASHVELTRYQKTVGRTEMAGAPLPTWSSPNGIDAILVAICICAVVLRNDLRSGRAYHPNRSEENNDELFTNLLGTLPYRDSTVRSCLQKVSSHVQWKSVDWRAE